MSVVEILNYTYEDYLKWEGEWELIEGAPVSMAPASMRKHQRIATELFYVLKSAVDKESFSKCEVLYGTDWKVSEETVVRPDIVLACEDEHDAYLTKAPKVIVEILSPATAKKDETIKFDIYEREGVQYYILVYPDDFKAKVYSLKEGRYIKVGDYTHEMLAFDDIACDMQLDFAQVFGKFRK